MTNHNESKYIYIETIMEKNLRDNIIINIEISRNSSEYDLYTESKLINIENKEGVTKIPLEGSGGYEIFINYKNSHFFRMYKDQVYYPFNTDVKNKFSIKEIDNNIHLLDYGLYKYNDKYSDMYFSHLLEDKSISDIPDYEKYIYPKNSNFIVEPLDTDTINYFSKLPRSELDQLTFIPSDKKKVEELRRQAGLIN